MIHEGKNHIPRGLVLFGDLSEKERKNYSVAWMLIY